MVYDNPIVFSPWTLEEMNAMCRPDVLIVPSAKFLRKARLTSLMRKKPKKGKR